MVSLLLQLMKAPVFSLFFLDYVTLQQSADMSQVGGIPFFPFSNSLSFHLSRFFLYVNNINMKEKPGKVK
jgi:hypothetical protein